MGEVVQFRDWQQPKDLARMYGEQTLEQQAVNLLAHALAGGPAENVIYESSLGFIDTAPSEYTAPTDDSA